MSHSERVALARWSEALRRDKALRARRRRRGAVAVLGAAAIGLLARDVSGQRPLLAWNASASEREGIYRIARDAPLRASDLVAAWAPTAARRLAARRLYLPLQVPLLKRIAAGAGARVCAWGATLRIDGRVRAIRLARDSLGRPMPWWSGCLKLGPGDYLLLGDGTRSFDGRYFGPTPKALIIGKAIPLWRG